MTPPAQVGRTRPLLLSEKALHIWKPSRELRFQATGSESFEQQQLETTDWVSAFRWADLAAKPGWHGFLP
jgi:hypothetical protein